MRPVAHEIVMTQDHTVTIEASTFGFGVGTALNVWGQLWGYLIATAANRYHS